MFKAQNKLTFDKMFGFEPIPNQINLESNTNVETMDENNVGEVVDRRCIFDKYNFE